MADQYDGEWDRHTTEEKYSRVKLLAECLDNAAEKMDGQGNG